MAMLYLRNKPIGAISRVTMPASSVTYGSGSVEDALDDKVSKSGDTMSGNLVVDRKDGTASAEGSSYLTIGNATPVGTDKNSTGLINLYSESAYPAVLYASPLTEIRYIGFQNKNGTVALTSDVDPLKTQETNPKASALGLTLSVHRRGYVYMLEISGSPTQALEPGNFYSFGDVSQLSGSAAALVDYVSIIEFNSSAIIRFWFGSTIYISTNIMIPSGSAFRAFGTFVIP